MALNGSTAIATAQWLQPGYDAANSFANSVEKALTRENVAQLHPVWRAPVSKDRMYIAVGAVDSGERTFVCSSSSGMRALDSANGLGPTPSPVRARRRR